MGYQSARIHRLQALLGKLLHVAQCYSSTRLFLNHMLAMLTDCPDKGTISLTPEFRKDLQWFKLYATSNNGVSMIEEGIRQPFNQFVDACNTGYAWCIVSS